MPFATPHSWPPASVQRSFGQRGAAPHIFAWPPGGTLLFSFGEQTDSSSPTPTQPAPAAASLLSGSASLSGYETREAHGGVDAETANAVISRARALMTVPAANNEVIDALRREFICLHAMEEGLNIY